MFRYYRLPNNNQIVNDKLIYIVGLIGKKYKTDFPKSRESLVKKGVRKIYLEINRNKSSITKRQIKIFLKPSYNNVTSKIPNNSFVIFETIIRILHNEKDLTKVCQDDFFKCLQDNGCHCRDRLANNLYDIMRFNSDSVNIFAIQNYKEFLTFNINCKKRCK